MKIVLGCCVLLVLQAQRSSCNDGFQLAQSDDCGKIDPVTGDDRTKVPWVAGIFGRASSSKPFDFIITGTVVDRYTIITVLGGVYGQPPAEGRKYSIPSAQNHKIAVGLKSTDLREADEYTQIVEVSYILPYSEDDPENKHFHFFLFKLKKPLDLKTPYVRAACLPVFAQHLPSTPYGQELDVFQGGFVAPGNALSSPRKELKIIAVMLENKAFCDEKFFGFYKSPANHVYCGRLSSKQEAICTSYGSAAVIPIYNSRWFVIGINALHPQAADQPSWCSKSTVFFYGRLLKAVDWVLDNLKCDGNEFSCGDNKCIGLDSVCNRRADCANGRDEAAIYCRARRPCLNPAKPFECGTYGPCLKKELVCDGKPDCPEGEDESQKTCSPQQNRAAVPAPSSVASRPASPLNTVPFEPVSNGASSVRCPPLQKSEGVIINCTDASGEKVSCDQAGPGSSARFQCQRHYVSTYRLPNTVMTCKEDGSWKPFRSFGCEAQCGILENKIVQSYIVEGQTATPREPFPWHAAIFSRRKNKDYSFICGGSLIEKNIVMTAAHCVTDGSGVQINANTLKIVLGGNSSTFEVNKRTDDAQIFSVKNVWVPATYDRRSLQSDIGLIQLDHEAEYGEYVRPVCYLQKGSNGVPPPGTLGKVPGYGYTAEEKISEYLQFAAFPVISPVDCMNSLRKTPPLNTFCAGYKNGTSVCQGDSGGGMVFPEVGTGQGGERYVLKGLVSHGDVKAGRLCDPNNYAVFTHVDAYADWVLQKLENILRLRK